MRSHAALFLVFLWISLYLAGCAPVIYEPSLIYPHLPDKPFQECSINLDFYKPVQQRLDQYPNIALAVAASGGGYRAANFAAGAMLGLEEIKDSCTPPRNVLSEVDYFSSVSGGGFAVGAYVSTLHDYIRFNGSTAGYSFADALALADSNVRCPCPCKPPDCKHKPPDKQKIDPCARRHLRGLYGDFIEDFLRTLLPWNQLGLDNRNLRFEQAIDDDVLGYCWRKAKLDPNDANATLTLADVFVPATDTNRQVVLPYWFANAAVYKNAVIFPFSPDHLVFYDVNGYYHRTKEHKFISSRQSYEQFIWNVPLSAAVASSANFPLALPPNRLASKMDPNNPYFYLLDGGVADNLGAITALRLLSDKTNENAPRKVLIVIDSYQGGLVPFTIAEKPPNEIAAAARLMEIGLDSWRARYREAIDRLCDSNNIKPVYLSFDDLVDANFNDLGLCEQDIKDLCDNMPRGCPKATPFYIARSISMTSPLSWDKQGLEYEMRKSRQNLLIAAGQYVVNKQRSEILNALGWK